MKVGPGTYWDRPGSGPTRFRVVRIIPSDDGPFVYALNVATAAGVVERFDRWAATAVRVV